MNKISITVNGESQEVLSQLTVQDLLLAQEYTADEIAVAVNTQFIPRSKYNSYIIKAEDKIDIVSPIQGG